MFTILKKFKQIQKNEKKENICRSHWRLLTWKFELILINERGAELFKAKLLIKLYQCFDHDRKFDDLKTNASTKIWFHFKCCSVKISNFSRAFKFRQTIIYMIFASLRWNFVINELFDAKKFKKWNEDEIIIIFSMFEWLIQIEVFEDLLIELNMLNHHYSNSFVEFVNNVIYSFLQTVVFQNVKFYLRYVILRKNHRLRTMIFSKFFRHWWNEVTFRKRYLHESLLNLIHNRHENRLLTMINFLKQNATNCTKFCEKLSQSFNEWAKKLMQRDQTIDDVSL